MRLFFIQEMKMNYFCSSPIASTWIIFFFSFWPTKIINQIIISPGKTTEKK